MRLCVLDVETTTKNKGNPYTKGNKLCTLAIKSVDGSQAETLFWTIEYDLDTYGNKLLEIRNIVEQSDLLIGFAIKFDLHWIKKYLPTISIPTIWDCQLAEFVISAQRNTMPSLEKALMNYGLGHKIDIISKDYWDKGIDTPDVPLELLREYNINDVEKTYELYLAQQKYLQGNKRKLFQLQCEDLKVLQEMEQNGLILNSDLMSKKSKELEIQRKEIEEALGKIIDPTGINWNSPQHLSVVLYGGYIKVPCMEKVQRVLKSGKVKEYERQGHYIREFDQKVEPISGTEGSQTSEYNNDALTRENKLRNSMGRESLQRYWSVDENTLKRLRGSKEVSRIIELCLKLAAIDKLLGTYYNGLKTLHKNYDWPERTINGTTVIEMHGSFNQCIAVTARLSSSNPNLQNIAGELKECIVSRYAD